MQLTIIGKDHRLVLDAQEGTRIVSRTQVEVDSPLDDERLVVETWQLLELAVNDAVASLAEIGMTIVVLDTDEGCHDGSPTLANTM